MDQLIGIEKPEGRLDPEGLPPCELSIVMPCLNEAETLETCIRKAKGFLESAGVDGEVVIGDNGSTDGSQAIAKRTGARVVDVPLRGYGLDACTTRPWRPGGGTSSWATPTIATTLSTWSRFWNGFVPATTW